MRPRYGIGKRLVEDLIRFQEVEGDGSGAAGFWRGAPMGLRNRFRIWEHARRRLAGNSNA
jgi:hypothetical protein